MGFVPDEPLASLCPIGKGSALWICLAASQAGHARYQKRSGCCSPGHRRCADWRADSRNRPWRSPGAGADGPALSRQGLRRRDGRSTVDIWSRDTCKGNFMTYFQRGLLAAVLMLLGLVFWPLLAVGGLIAWTVYSDIRDEPERKRQEAESEARLNKPITVEDMRWSCESPAEEAFFDAMVSAYATTAGPGCIAGDGIQLRTQIGLGQLRIGRSSAWRQFRGDFLIDDKLVVEIDGATGRRGTAARTPWPGMPHATRSFMRRPTRSCAFRRASSSTRLPRP
jgi:hypothetical protein